MQNHELRRALASLERASQEVKDIENGLVENQGRCGAAIAWGVVFYYRVQQTDGVDAQIAKPQERRPSLFAISKDYWCHIRGISLLARADGRKVFTRCIESSKKGSPFFSYRQEWFDVPVRENDRPITHYPQFPFRDGSVSTHVLAIAFFRSKAEAQRFFRVIREAPESLAEASED